MNTIEHTATPQPDLDQGKTFCEAARQAPGDGTSERSGYCQAHSEIVPLSSRSGVRELLGLWGPHSSGGNLFMGLSLVLLLNSATALWADRAPTAIIGCPQSGIGSQFPTTGVVAWDNSLHDLAVEMPVRMCEVGSMNTRPRNANERPSIRDLQRSIPKAPS